MDHSEGPELDQGVPGGKRGGECPAGVGMAPLRRAGAGPGGALCQLREAAPAP